MSTHRPPRDPRQALADAARVQRTGGERFTRSASPIPEVTSAVSRALGSVGTVTEKASKIDQFTLAADGAQDLTLTYLPQTDSENVILRRLGLYLTTDYTISGQTLSLLASDVTPTTGDKVQVQYDYLTGTPATPAASAGDYVAEVMLDAPIAYWRLDEASGTAVADYTGHGHGGTTAAGSGTVTRATTTLLTAANGGVRSTKFLGYGARVNVPTSAAFDTSAFTIEFFTSKGGSTANPVWHHPGRMRVLVSGGAMDVHFWSGGAWSHKWRFAGLTGSDDVVNHHVAITWDGTTMKAYVEGGLDSGTSMGAATLPSATGGPEFGDGADGINSGECLRLQEYAVYGTALSAARVAAHVAAR